MTSLINSVTAERSRLDAEMSSARADVEDAVRDRAETAERAAKLQARRRAFSLSINHSWA